ncbi:MAG: aminotransferase class IV [Flavisolibacter sp.]
MNNRILQQENALLHFKDLAVQRGYGIFDFFKFIDQQPVFLEDHLDRFFASAEEMRLPIEQTREELKDIIYQLIQKNQVADGGIRMTLTGGYSPDGYEIAAPNLILSQHHLQKPSKELFHKGLKLITYPFQRQLAHVKTIDYLMAIWLQPVVKKNKADDLLYHNNGKITECPRANIFIVTQDEKIITPSENILKGISRKKIIELAKDHFEVLEKTVTLEDIRKAKEAFISSSTKLILPVSCIDDHFMTGTRPVTAKLYNLFELLQNNHTETIIKM